MLKLNIVYVIHGLGIVKNFVDDLLQVITLWIDNRNVINVM